MSAVEVLRPKPMEFDSEVITRGVLYRMTNTDLAALDLVSTAMHSFVSRLRDDNYLHHARVLYFRPCISDIDCKAGEIRWRDVYDCVEALSQGRWIEGRGHDEAEIALLTHMAHDPRGTAPVMTVACTFGYTRVASLVLTEHMGDRRIAHYLDVACANSQCEIVSLILEDKRLRPELSNRLLLNACQHPQPDVVRLLLEDGRWDPTVLENMCLMEAVSTGDKTILGLLLKDGRANLNRHLTWSVLTLARAGRVDMIRMLLNDPRSDLAGDRDVVLERACSLGQMELVRLLLRDGLARITTNALDKAWRAGHTETLRLLLSDIRATIEMHKAYNPDETWSYKAIVMASACVGALVVCSGVWYKLR